MASIPSLLLESEPTEGEVQVIMDDDQIFQWNPEEVDHPLDRFPAQIHEGERFDEKDVV